MVHGNIAGEVNGHGIHVLHGQGGVVHGNITGEGFRLGTAGELHGPHRVLNPIV